MFETTVTSVEDAEDSGCQSTSKTDGRSAAAAWTTTRTTVTITTNELRTLPELHGKTQSAVSSTHIYVPDKISIVADHEIPLIKELLPPEVKQLKT